MAAASDSQEERIARLEAQLAAMQEEMDRLKQQVAEPPAAPVATAEEKAIVAAVDRAMQQYQDRQPVLPDWVSQVTLSGDFRYRNIWMDDRLQNNRRNRHMIQARVGLYGAVNDEWGYGIRLASGGSNSPISNNQDLGDGFSSKNIWLDTAYFDFHPADVPGLNVYGGKFDNPYYRVGNSDLMLDTDVTPEGIAAVYKTRFSDDVEMFGVFGGHYVEERALGADTSLWGTQAGATWRFGDHRASHLTAGGGYYNYGNLKNRRALGGDADEFYGNRSADDRYVNDFDLVQGFAEVGLPAGKWPVRFFGDYFLNTQAPSGHNTAYLVGAGLGRTTAPGSWAVTYNYRRLEADALLGVIAEATFAGGGTDIRGHKFSFNYQLADKTEFVLTYMPAKRTRNGQTDDFDVFMADVTLKF